MHESSKTPTLREYARMVQSVRAKQKSYFAERTLGALETSKAGERELDRVTREILDARPSLFEGRGEPDD